jgi:hypothetical protein
MIQLFIGKTFTKVEKIDNLEIIFTCKEGSGFKMFHDHECCETVFIEDIVGDLQDLVGSPILKAEEVDNTHHQGETENGSFTWTYYKLATIKGYVDIRWYGESNGFYSESVDIRLLSEGEF